MRTIRKTGIRGFTLIELLVVMAVMSILVGVGINTFSIAQKKARDSKRKADLRTIQTALEAYAVNNNGLYPPTGNQCAAGSGPPTGYAGIRGVLGTYLGTNYLSQVPVDPISDDCDVANNTAASDNRYAYEYTGIDAAGASCATAGGCPKYGLAARMEDRGDKDACTTCTTKGSWYTGDYLYIIQGPQ